MRQLHLDPEDHGREDEQEPEKRYCKTDRLPVAPVYEKSIDAARSSVPRKLSCSDHSEQGTDDSRRKRQQYEVFKQDDFRDQFIYHSLILP